MNINKAKLAILALVPVSVFAVDYDSVVDDSVVGNWRFNDTSNYGKDSSGTGSDITSWNNNASGKADSSRGGGYLNLPKSGSIRSLMR